MGRIIHCDFQKNATTRTSLGPVKFDSLGNAEVSDQIAEKLLTVKGYTEQMQGQIDDTPPTSGLTTEEIKQRQIAELGNKKIDELKQLATSLEIQLPTEAKKKEDVIRLIVESGKLPQPSAQ